MAHHAGGVRHLHPGAGNGAGATDRQGRLPRLPHAEGVPGEGQGQVPVRVAHVGRDVPAWGQGA